MPAKGKVVSIAVVDNFLKRYGWYGHCRNLKPNNWSLIQASGFIVSLGPLHEACEHFWPLRALRGPILIYGESWPSWLQVSLLPANLVNELLVSNA
jgi:hypothetical protein